MLANISQMSNAQVKRKPPERVNCVSQGLYWAVNCVSQGLYWAVNCVSLGLYCAVLKRPQNCSAFTSCRITCWNSSHQHLTSGCCWMFVQSHQAAQSAGLQMVERTDTTEAFFTSECLTAGRTAHGTRHECPGTSATPTTAARRFAGN